MRVDIKTGYLCNNYCRFCVQAHNRPLGNRSNEEIKRALKEAREKGITEVVLTGGEVTIRSDVLELIEYAKKLGFEVIQLQSNGRRFADINFLKKAIKAGANEFGPALHGHIPELHDYLTRAKGAWKQTVLGIKNIKKFGFRVITNTVVVKPNYRFLPEIAKLLVELGVDQFQFAFVHALGNAWINYESMMPTVSLAVPYIKKGLQIGISNGRMVMAEAMPYCVMKYYERYVSELYIPYTILHEKNYWVENFMEVKVVEGKKKFVQCKDCKFRFICEGPWREYPERMGEDEFQPVLGKPLFSTEELLENTEEYPIDPLKRFGKIVLKVKQKY